MDGYIRNRVVIDARHAIALAEQQAQLEHQGLKGRLREIITQRLLRPWFPPSVACGTGTIINGKTERHRQYTQDDLIVFDRTLTPPILVDESVSEGVFLNNSVLCRIEIKSKLRIGDVRQFVESSVGLRYVSYVVPPSVSHEYAGAKLLGRNALLAFDSDTTGSAKEFARLTDILNKTPEHAVSFVCVLGRGLWMLRVLDGEPLWHRLKADEKEQQLACFVAVMSSTVFAANLERTGADPTKALQAGIGNYFPEDDEWEIVRPSTPSPKLKRRPSRPKPRRASSLQDVRRERKPRGRVKV